MLQMMLKKEVIEPDESFCEENEGGHSESIAMPEEVATDTTAMLGAADGADSLQRQKQEKETSSSNVESVLSHGELSGEPPQDGQAESRHDVGKGDDRGLEEPLLPNGHQVRKNFS